MNAGFPTDDYTPHGYLANPYAVAHSWSEGSGGNLRSLDDGVGFGWVYPWARDAQAGAGLRIAMRHGERLLLTREDFAAAGLTAPHHSAHLFEYAWIWLGLACAARFVLIGEDELGVEIELRSSPHSRPLPLGEGGNKCASRGEGFVLYVGAAGWSIDSTPCGAIPATLGDFGAIDLGPERRHHRLIADAGNLGVTALGTASTFDSLILAGPGERMAQQGAHAAIAAAVTVPTSNGAATRINATLRRQADSKLSYSAPPHVSIQAAVRKARERDDQFWRVAARPVGDWPPSWRRGWVYDLETTRMCVFPAGGIFRDVWPSWMIQWPRVVLAEGSLDALRLSYGDPRLAQRVALSMLRDAPAPNVPCLFQHGEPNMVAKDGSVCGTSPAWCVPFYNLERLYLRTLDREWLAAVYEPLDRYLYWWLRERTDRLGWVVYKCTWEAGEDDTPRLDPERRGDNVVSEFVRPVELQATVALSAGVLARFAAELGRLRDAARWQSVARAFATRTHELWDPAAGRFRDWDSRRGDFLAPSGEANYWGIDPCRHSVLALTPLLAGLATPDQRRVLARELEEYARPPWTLWASWSYVLLEAAMAAGEREFAGRVAAEIVGRMYAELDRRSLGEPRGPTPGVAREYWPLESSRRDACDGYGWGASTTSFFIRQIFGFLESEEPTSVRFRLAPWLPPELVKPGATYGFANIPYRGHSIDVSYSLPGDLERAAGSVVPVQVIIATRVPTRCRVVGEGRLTRYDAGPSASHTFRLELGREWEAELHDRSR